MLEHGPDAMRLGCAISGDAIYQWFDQAAPGLGGPADDAERQDRSTSGTRTRDRRREARASKDGTPEFKKFVDDDYQRQLDELDEDRSARRSAATIDRYLGDLRGLVRSVGFFIGEKDGVELGCGSS